MLNKLIFSFIFGIFREYEKNIFSRIDIQAPADRFQHIDSNCLLFGFCRGRVVAGALSTIALNPVASVRAVGNPAALLQTEGPQVMRRLFTAAVFVAGHRLD